MAHHQSGIPPFRGPGGLWSKYDPRMLEIDYFRAHPRNRQARHQGDLLRHLRPRAPERGPLALARLETAGTLKVLITQNVDSVQ